MANSGQFQKGQSGNVKGRPRGSKNVFTRYRQQIDKATPAIIDMLIDLAVKERSIPAAKLLIDRTLPPDFVEYEKLEKRLLELEEMK